MTAVKINHEGVDVLEMRASATNSNEIHFTSKHNVFNADLSYMFAVTDLNVDCSSLPIFPASTNDTLFTLKRRQLVNNALPDVTLGNPQVIQRLQVLQNGRKYFDIATFMSDVSNTAYTFSKQQDLIGVNAGTHGGDGKAIGYYLTRPNGPLYYLTIGFDAGGRIMFKGVSGFWNNFVIELSDFAVKLFQLQDVVFKDNNGVSTLSLTNVANVIQFDSLYTNAQQNALTPNAGLLTSSTVVGKSSILKFLDHRLFLSVETHLPIQRNLRVHNGDEQTDTSIVRAPFLNHAESTIFSKDNTIADEVSLTTKSYVGRVNFVKKTSPILKWNTLTSAFEQRIFRFQVYCTYNVFANGAFTQTKFPVPFPENAEWDLSLRFVSKI